MIVVDGSFYMYFYQDGKHFKYDGWSTDVESIRQLLTINKNGMAMFDRIKTWSIKKFKEKKNVDE